MPQPELIGEGSSRIALAVPLVGEGEGTDIRRGAELAIEDLGGGALTLAVYDLAADDAPVAAAVSAATKQDTKLMGVLGDSAHLNKVEKRAFPVLAFGPSDSNMGGAPFPFRPSVADSLVYGVRFALASKPGSVVLFVPEGQGRDAEKLAARIGELAPVGTISYSQSQTSVQIAKRAAKGVREASVLAFAGNDSKIARIVESVGTSKTRDKAIVGNLSWDEGLVRAEPLNGALIATIDLANREFVAAPYRAKYGKDPSLSALMGYDFVAVAAGIVRSGGPQALTPQAVTNQAGFLGSTGRFRFRQNGDVERIYELSIVRDSQIVPFSPPLEGF